ncbi:hypothetical protein [Embleya sp. NPDC020630]|uniref:hypothetical protein n=1 Tax=Embleya sp. NPDC020630 TaxID=3363979 RepID=UPI0037AC4BDD
MNPVNSTPTVTETPAVPAAFDRAGESPLAMALRRVAAESEAGGPRIGYNSFVGGE